MTGPQSRSLSSGLVPVALMVFGNIIFAFNDVWLRRVADDIGIAQTVGGPVHSLPADHDVWRSAFEQRHFAGQDAGGRLQALKIDAQSANFFFVQRNAQTRGIRDSNKIAFHSDGICGHVFCKGGNADWKRAIEQRARPCRGQMSH